MSDKVMNQFGLRDLRGQKFGKLLVHDLVKRLPNGKILWKCLCDCGTSVDVRHDYLLHTNSPKTHCGCANKGPSVLRPLEYAVWSMMIKRCEDPGHVSYAHYGGRGIRVCERWHDFALFCQDMGPRKNRNWSLERKDNAKGYQPDNCIWIQKKMQGRNRRNTVRIPHPGTGLLVPAAEVAEYLGISYQKMRARYMAEGKWPEVRPEVRKPAGLNSAVDESDGEDIDEDDTAS